MLGNKLNKQLTSNGAAREAQYTSKEEARQRHIDLLNQQQENSTANNNNLNRRISQMELRIEDQSRKQSRMAETAQGTQLILSDILRKLSELNTNNFIASTPPNPSTPETASIDWDTPAQQLPAHIYPARPNLIP
jgi:hypothetical protein